MAVLQDIAKTIAMSFSFVYSVYKVYIQYLSELMARCMHADYFIQSVEGTVVRTD
ncbi:hypothetical protein NCCP2716_00130 [Sporosarcina sp. NCCP-2716]|nr:hypothetical protein NCCP2716_00130 [Sporosarcina sp. NCCP-2716]